MASAEGFKSRRRKGLDPEVNLVPFIDLLSVCICFLLMTAVWVQIGALKVKQSHGTQGAVAEEKKIDLDVRFRNPQEVVISVKQKGRRTQNIRVSSGSFDDLVLRFDEELGKLAGRIGRFKDVVGAGRIFPKTGVSYGNLVSIMDVLRKNDISNLGVVPAKGG